MKPEPITLSELSDILLLLDRHIENSERGSEDCRRLEKCSIVICFVISCGYVDSVNEWVRKACEIGYTESDLTWFKENDIVPPE